MHGNAGNLSANKRKAHFELLTEAEIARFEIIVERAFTLELAPEEVLLPPAEKPA